MADGGGGSAGACIHLNMNLTRNRCTYHDLFPSLGIAPASPQMVLYVQNKRRHVIPAIARPRKQYMTLIATLTFRAIAIHCERRKRRRSQKNKVSRHPPFTDGERLATASRRYHLTTTGAIRVSKNRKQTAYKMACHLNDCTLHVSTRHLLVWGSTRLFVGASCLITCRVENSDNISSV